MHISTLQAQSVHTPTHTSARTTAPSCPAAAAASDAMTDATPVHDALHSAALLAQGSPRNALWCERLAHTLLTSSAVDAAVVVGTLPVAIGMHAAGASGIVVDVAGGWRWPAHLDDHVGEITLWAGDAGLTAVGWWTPLSQDPVTLVMDVAGITLWNDDHELTTEDPARIRALLAAARTAAVVQP